LKQLLARWALLPLVAAVVLVVDQWTKSLIRANLPLWDSFAPIPALAPYFNIVHWTNTGAAFGLLQGQGGLFVVVAIVVVVVVLIYTRQLPADNWPVRVCLGMQLGGAIGNNLFDRLRFGHVTDFLLFTLPIGDRVYLWPAWNVADGSIVVGVILLGLLLLRAEGKKSEVQQAEA
jgi:signal peptidase II